MVWEIKTYSYPNINVYYLVLNGRQIGPPYFTRAKAEDMVRSIMSGEDWE